MRGAGVNGIESIAAEIDRLDRAAARNHPNLGSTGASPVCAKCSLPMIRGKALEQTYVGGTPDFPGDTHASTFSAGGPGRLIDCWKCPECGWSITGEERDGSR